MAHGAMAGTEEFHECRRAAQSRRLSRAPVRKHRRARSTRFQNQAQQMGAGVKARARRRAGAKLCGAAWGAMQREQEAARAPIT